MRGSRVAAHAQQAACACADARRFVARQDGRPAARLAADVAVPARRPVSPAYAVGSVAAAQTRRKPSVEVAALPERAQTLVAGQRCDAAPTRWQSPTEYAD